MTKDNFITCARLYTPNLLRFSKRVAGNVIEAEDIVQECFEVLWNNKEKVEIGSAKSYLFSVAHKKIMDTYRSDCMMQELDSVLNELKAKSDDRDDQQLVQLAMEQIPALFKELLTLRDLESYSYREIETITGLTESQVKVYLFRARKAVKERILKLELV
ncbi:MAG: sigma-70 family RNA polymerase sigma factor [Bacteroidales bacterium]|nr:sigma-70 family RNA polymerase sigma factor [Bacteroidales bacterium]